MTTKDLLAALNGPWHKQASLIFLGIVMAHWVEHLLQAVQVFVLGWPRPQSRGALGMVWPWLVTSEWLHYAYAIVMLVGLVILRRGYVGRAGVWWSVALWIQVWHHFEHVLLLGQVLVGKNLFGSPVPTSILQQVVPRVELHLFYNAIVFAPMLVAMLAHLFPRESEIGLARCNCARRQVARELLPAGSAR